MGSSWQMLSDHLQDSIGHLSWIQTFHACMLQLLWNEHLWLALAFLRLLLEENCTSSTNSLAVKGLKVCGADIQIFIVLKRHHQNSILNLFVLSGFLCKLQVLQMLAELPLRYHYCFSTVVFVDVTFINTDRSKVIPTHALSGIHLGKVFHGYVCYLCT